MITAKNADITANSDLDAYFNSSVYAQHAVTIIGVITNSAIQTKTTMLHIPPSYGIVGIPC